MSKYKLKEKDQVGFGRRVQLQFKYKYFLVFIFIYVYIYMFIYMLIYVSSAKKLIKNSYFVAVGIWCGCIWVEIWGNHQRCFDCPGVQGKTFRS